MTPAELAVWLMSHGWTTTTYTGEIIAEHPTRGRRRWTPRTTADRIGGSDYWHVQRIR